MTRSIEKLTAELEAARAAAAAAFDAWRMGQSNDHVREADERRLEAERALSRALGQETAARLEWPLPCDPGAPMPQVFADGSDVLLTYYVRDSSPPLAEPVAPEAAREGVALVRFKRCSAHRLGPPNDETMQGHPLYGRGLSAHQTHLVERSSWVAELEVRNRVHSRHRAEAYTSLRHYLLTFHDETFECIARDHVIQLRRGAVRDVLLQAVGELLG